MAKRGRPFLENKKKSVLVLLPPEVISSIDFKSKKVNRSRSNYIRGILELITYYNVDVNKLKDLVTNNLPSLAENNISI